MTDISKCLAYAQDGVTMCPMREKCYRFTAPAHYPQTFITAPFTSPLWSCMMYWPTHTEVAEMSNGKWMKPPGSRIQHFILTPRDENLAQRHSACGQLFLLGLGTYDKSKAKRCPKCATPG